MTNAIATPPPSADKIYTTEDLLAMPDDGIERWLIDGKIVEVGMTIRNKHHTRVESRVSYLLCGWLETLPSARGSVHAGEVGVRLRHDPELTVGIDVVYLSADEAARNRSDEETTIIEGPPTLAVEIQSPSDTFKKLGAKIRQYRDAGVKLVWVIDPDFRTVTVHRLGHPPALLNDTQELDGGTELPGFRVPVARLFDE